MCLTKDLSPTNQKDHVLIEASPNQSTRIFNTWLGIINANLQPSFCQKCASLDIKMLRFIPTVQWTQSDSMPVIAGHKGMFSSIRRGRVGFAGLESCSICTESMRVAVNGCDCAVKQAVCVKR